jgi:predicted small lipoprotein YifL
MKRFIPLLLAVALLSLLTAAACGLKDRLVPRDKLVDDERLPPEWEQASPDPLVGELGADGLMEKAGNPARVRGADLTPEEVTPEAAPPPEAK